MTSDSFNQLFNEYCQQVVETNTAAVNATSPDRTPTWLQTLQRHVQEWKQHYGAESAAIMRAKSKYSEQQLGPTEWTGPISNQEQELNEIMQSFQARREAIWMRQQQELNQLGMSVD